MINHHIRFFFLTATNFFAQLIFSKPRFQFVRCIKYVRMNRFLFLFVSKPERRYLVINFYVEYKAFIGRWILIVIIVLMRK